MKTINIAVDLGDETVLTQEDMKSLASWVHGWSCSKRYRVRTLGPRTVDDVTEEDSGVTVRVSAK
jgi:hypothetical protein